MHRKRQRGGGGGGGGLRGGGDRETGFRLSVNALLCDDGGVRADWVVGDRVVTLCVCVCVCVCVRE